MVALGCYMGCYCPWSCIQYSFRFRGILHGGINSKKSPLFRYFDLDMFKAKELDYPQAVERPFQTNEIQFEILSK